MSTKNLKETFECELCIEPFNQYDHKPYSLVPCGHTICSACLNKLEINKTLCPFCRSESEQKIPNWEIIKHLPKPSVPLIYNHVKLKLEAFSKRIDQELFVTANEFTNTIELLEKLVESFKTLKNKSETKEHQEILDKLVCYQNFLNSLRSRILELGGFLNLQIDCFNREIEKEENKYNAINLKITKLDIEKLNKSLNLKVDLIKESNERLIKILITLTANSDKSEQSKRDENIVKLEYEFLELKTIALITQKPDNPCFTSSLTNNAIRPSSNLSNFPTSHPVEEVGTYLDTGLKLKRIVLISSFLAASMVYPVSMIAIANQSLNKCPINNLIPVWCLVGGSTILVSEILTAALLVYYTIRFRRHKSFSEKLIVIIFNILPLISSILFYIAWFFAGNSWIYSAYRTVQFKDTSIKETFCQETIFLFSFWTLNLTYIFLGVLLLIGNFFCCIYCFINNK